MAIDVDTVGRSAGGHQREDGLWVFTRQEFCSRRFHYKPGQHVVFAGPTQRAGKTTLAFDLLEYTATPQLPAYVAVSKPHDPVSAKRGAELGFRRVESWPVSKRVRDYFNDPPPGYLIWPKFGNIDSDVARCAFVTARLLGDRYTAGVRRKHGILVLDDTMVKSKVMGLDKEMTTIIAMSGAMGLGGWYFVQKPTDSGRAAIWSYGNSEHLFLSKDPDARNRKRYDEIGGVDPHEVERATQRLKPYEFVYLKRTEGFMCVVGAS